MKDFRSLDVWKKSHELVLAIYRVTAAFPKNELYGLISQIRRAPWNKSQVAIPWGGQQLRFLPILLAP